MLDFIKENTDNAIKFIQEKYGELTKDEIAGVKEKPEQLFELVKEKFGASKDEVENFFNDKFGKKEGIKDKVSDVASDVSDAIGGLFGKKK